MNALAFAIEPRAGAGRRVALPARTGAPIERALDLLAPRWTVPILERLAEERRPLRFNEIERRVAPISQKELAKRLRALEAAGVVERTVHPEVPPRVEYELTGPGRALLPLVADLGRWAREHAPAEQPPPL